MTTIQKLMTGLVIVGAFAAHAQEAGEQVAAQAANSEANTTAARSYGPIVYGESLSTVALQITEETGVHVAQVMWSLYDANRSAFDGSINRLRVGARFEVPPPEQMTRISIGEARGLIRDAVFGTAAPTTTGTAVPTTTNPAIPATQPVIYRAGRQAESGEIPPEQLQEPAADPAAGKQPATAGLDESSPEAFSEAPDAFAEAPDAFADAPDAFAEAPDQATASGSAPAEPEVSAPAQPEKVVQSPAVAPAVTSSSTGEAPKGNNNTILLLVALVAGLIVMAVLVQLPQMRRKREAREEERRAAEQQASQRRSDLADLARGQPISDTPEAAASDPYAETVAMEESPIAEPEARPEPAPAAPAETPAANTADEDAFAKTVAMERPVLADPPADTAAGDADTAVPAAGESPQSSEDDPAFARTVAMESPVIAAPSTGDDEPQQSFDDGITPGDDISSKLDLARGYANMSDAEQARPLLEEVIDQGTEEQQAEARRILEGLQQ